jgi:hypothetical protein
MAGLEWTDMADKIGRVSSSPVQDASEAGNTAYGVLETYVSILVAKTGFAALQTKAPKYEKRHVPNTFK